MRTTFRNALACEWWASWSVLRYYGVANTPTMKCVRFGETFTSISGRIKSWGDRA